MERPTRLERIRSLHRSFRPREGEVGVSGGPEEIPDIPEAVVLWLESMYPDACPDPALSDAEIRERCIQVALVRHVRVTWAAQELRRMEAGLPGQRGA